MTPTASQPPVMDYEHLQQLTVARQALKKIRRAVGTARFEAYTLIFCGALTFIFGLGSVAAMLAGMIVTAIGFVEITAASRIARLDLAAVRMLTINTLCLAVLILVYALWNLTSEIRHPQSLSDLPGISASDAQAMEQMIGPADAISHQVMLLLYGSLIAAAVVEGALAYYYYSRGPILRQYLAQTPAWIVDMQKAGVRI